MESNFCRLRVIHDLFLNFNFCLEIFFREPYISKIEMKGYMVFHKKKIGV